MEKLETSVRFENAIDIAYKSVQGIPGIEKNNSVTFVRNINGQIAIVLEWPTSSAPEELKDQVDAILRANLGAYYSGVIIDAIIEPPVFDYVCEQRSPLTPDSKFYFAKMGVAKLSWLKNGQEQCIWPFSEVMEKAKPFVTTFYSFKGGMGRTTALIGVALSLAKSGKRVTIIDLDIEAPGIASVFLSDIDSRDSFQVGVVDYCIEPARGRKELTIEKINSDIYDESSSGTGAIFIVPSGVVNEYYLEKLACLDLQQDKETTLKNALFSLIQLAAEETLADYILLDSRAGFHEIAGLVLSSFSHAAILFGNTSMQSMTGLSQAIRLLSNYNKIPNQESEKPFLAFVHGLARPKATTQGAEDYERYREALYDTCIREGYYFDEDETPNLNAANVVHEPFSLSFQDELREGIKLSNDMLQSQRSAIVEVLTSADYARLANRLREWSGH